MKVYSVYDPEFRKYGQVLENYDFAELFDALDKTNAPEAGIEYVASVDALERTNCFKELEDRAFGGMPIQIGYCNGTNNQLNCLEYHKNSELNIVRDDIILLLGLQSEIRDGAFDTSLVKAFRVPAGTGVEMFATTLHYAPCGAGGITYRVACVLPRGTNAALGKRPEIRDGESKMLAAVNKWLLAHSESAEAGEGNYVGLTGENISIR